MQKNFEALDKDGNGKLSLEELVEGTSQFKFLLKITC